jgi:hypothetical protein
MPVLIELFKDFSEILNGFQTYSMPENLRHGRGFASLILL